MNSEHIIQSVVCMLAIDGTISPQERAFLQQLQRRLGVPAKVLQAALDMAKQGKGRVQLAEEPAEQQRIFEVLVHAALADGTISTQERRILDAVGAKIGLSQELIAQSVDHYTAQTRQNLSQSTRLTQSPTVSSSSPAPEAPATRTCPKCGTEQDADRTDCVRCGIIFSRFTPSEPVEDMEESVREPLYHEYYEDDTGRAAEQLEQLQSVSALLNHVGPIAIALIVIVLVIFGVANMPELGGYRFFIVLGLLLIATLVIGHFTILNVAGVITRGEVVNKWMYRQHHHRRHYRRYGRYGGTPRYTYYIEYVFQPGSDDAGTLRRGKASVSRSQYNRYRIGAPVKVRYLPGFSWIFRLEVW